MTHYAMACESPAALAWSLTTLFLILSEILFSQSRTPFSAGCTQKLSIAECKIQAQPAQAILGWLTRAATLSRIPDGNLPSL
jgi:hypothetical protein